ncbi:ABC transporter permease [Bacteroidota bacterium]
MKSKLFTTINLVGLTAGLTVSFFLLIYIINELSYNSFHHSSDRIYRMIMPSGEGVMPYTPSLLPVRLKEISPGVLATGGLISMPLTLGSVAVENNRHYQEEPGFFCADPSLLDILTINIIHGEGKSGLERDGGVVISQPTAERYFGQANPIGKQLHIRNNGIPVTLTVTGVFEKLPWNSTVRIDFLANMDLFRNLMDQFGVDLSAEASDYSDAYFENYILLDAETGIDETGDQLTALKDSLGLTEQIGLISFQNIRDIHLDSAEISNDFHQKGTRSALFYYGSLALAILLLAGINYSILSTARSALRFKEIGVRKVLGATKRELRVQILTESMFLTSLALPLSFLVLGFVEPFVDKLYGYQIQLYTWNMLVYIPLFALITLLIGFVSGGYLAFYLSALTPLRAIKNQVIIRQRFGLSKAFIVFQLFITLLLLGSVLTIFSQLDYCLNTEGQIQKNNLLILSFNPEEFSSYTELRDRMQDEEGVEGVSGSSIIPPTNAFSTIGFTLGRDSTTVVHQLENYFVDSDFFTTLGIEILEGEDIDPSHANDSMAPIVINQKALALINYQQHIGVSLGNSIITGIVKDFNIHSLYKEITPTVFLYNPSKCKYLVVRCQPSSLQQVRSLLEEQWKSLAPDLPFDCKTFGDELNMMYSSEQKFGQVVASFSILAFLITGMGLFGLALLMIERRLKEIAVRKIFGASNRDILFRMQKEFLIYILVASLFAVPVIWYVMTIWLSAFYYKAPIHWYLFVIAVLSVAIFVSSIIAIRTWAVLRKNLINVLKYE